MRDQTKQATRKVLLGLGALLGVIAVVVTPASVDAAQDDTLITSTSVAGVEIGGTVDQLRSSLSAYEVSDDVRLTVDLRGHTVSKDGTVVFRAAQVVPDSPQLELFIVTSNAYRTAAGVGPGTTIAEAVEQYGQATLMLDQNNGGREFVTFANQPEGPIGFRTYGIAGAYLGIYEGNASTTTNYQDDAAIASVWIGCTSAKACARAGVDGDTSADSSADTTAEDKAAADKAAEEKAAADKAAEEKAAADKAAEEKAAADKAAEEQAAADKAAADKAAEEQAAAENAATSTADSGEVLAKTGTTQTKQIVLVAALLFLGMSLVLLETRFSLGPEWLR